ncbi:MAG: O-antigen ligase family protein [Patescibacteria group bacterium]|nr:O-antigen ligase family protein [Patescibacteria group bacterium]
MLQKIITFSFYTLFFFTPLFWRPVNYELFEYNKMMLVYALTVIIAASWLLKMIRLKKLILKKTPLDIPILLFLLANIASTIFSVDPHTSIWGYYTRSNGGLLSTISYITLYYALVSNYSGSYVSKFLKAALLGGVITAAWAIPEHFGGSPSCAILTGQFTDACWIQDVRARVFSTLGQPNWLGGYLVMLIFPAIYFILTSTTKLTAIRYTLCAIILYLAFTFTYSRAATLGLLGGLALFLPLQYFSFVKKRIKITFPEKWRLSLAILLLFFSFNLIFGSAISRFSTNLSLPFATKAVSSNTPVPASTVTQLETEGNETGEIRLIVWKGALEIFKHYPIFGSGVETFAYTYYNFRPVEHNMVSEWDFLYNKAHNEFLNYLATTGAVGFLTYIGLIAAYFIWSIRYVFKTSTDNDKQIKEKKLLVLAFLASAISYHIQDFFGFSVVIIALFFFLFPAMAFMLTEDVQPVELQNSKLGRFLYRRTVYPKLAQAVILIFATFTLLTLINDYQADINFAQGSQADELGNPGRAYNFLVDAVSLNSNEPLYHSELGYAAAAASVALQTDDPTTSAKLQTQALEETQKSLNVSPKNLSFLRTAIRTYYVLSTMDKNFSTQTMQTLDQAIALAPTDPKLVYNKAVILNQEGQTNEAVNVFLKAIQLKPNYRDAYYSLGLLYWDINQKDKAIEQMNTVLKINPTDTQASEKLKEWQK